MGLIMTDNSTMRFRKTILYEIFVIFSSRMLENSDLTYCLALVSQELDNHLIDERRIFYNRMRGSIESYQKFDVIKLVAEKTAQIPNKTSLYNHFVIRPINVYIGQFNLGKELDYLEFKLPENEQNTSKEARSSSRSKLWA